MGDFADIPMIKGIHDVEAIERTPLSARNLPRSTYAGIAAVAKAQPQELAIRYIEHGEAWLQARESGAASLSRDVSYGEFLRRIHQTANLFRDLGIGDQDVVSMVLPNVPEAYYVLWGGEAAGIVNPINYLLEASEIGEIIDAAGSKILVIMGEHPDLEIIDKLPVIRRHAPGLEHVLVLSASAPAPEGCLDFMESLEAVEGDRLTFERDIAPEQTASLFHTGGTTGLPKLARHSHENEVYIGWALNLHLRYKPGETSLVGLPIFHCNAAISSGLVAFMAGGTVLLAGLNGFRTPGVVKNLFQIVDHYGVVNFNAVPTIYAMLVQQGRGDCTLETLRLPTCGAAPMPVELFNKFEKQIGVRISEGYGLTEATVCSTVCPIVADPPRIGSIGIRLPYTQVMAAILDEAGAFVRECEIDEIGVILISGPAATPGYTDESRNKSLFVTDGDGVKWVNTGDLARQDLDGFFWMTGRAKELIIRGGHNIDPKTIEEVLAAHPAVNLAAAVGRPDSYAGELPVAYVDTVSPVSEQELIEYCKTNIKERAAIPKAIIILDKLPVTGVGKIHKPTLALMEIKAVVERELEKYASELDDSNVIVNADPKYGSMTYLKLKCSNGDRANIVEKDLREALDGYSFKSEIHMNKEMAFGA